MLTTVVSTDPVYVEFEGDERMYLKYQDLARAGEIAYGLIPDLEKKLKAVEEQKSATLANEAVTETQIAGVVSRWTGIPVDKMMEGEREKLLAMEAELGKRVIGQADAVALQQDDLAARVAQHHLLLQFVAARAQALGGDLAFAGVAPREQRCERRPHRGFHEDLVARALAQPFHARLAFHRAAHVAGEAVAQARGRRPGDAADGGGVGLGRRGAGEVGARRRQRGLRRLGHGFGGGRARHRRRGFAPGMFPHAERIGAGIVTLPLFPAMHDSDVDRVCQALSEVIGPALRDGAA